jgi:excisionase family DNA binding protein
MPKTTEHNQKTMKPAKIRQLEETSNAFMTPTEVAKLLRVSSEKVLGWILHAELRAINVGSGVRPRYSISRDSFDEFLTAREFQPLLPYVTKQRHPSQGGSIKGGPLDPVFGEQLLKKKQAVCVGGTYFRIINGIIQFY